MWKYMHVGHMWTTQKLSHNRFAFYLEKERQRDSTTSCLGTAARARTLLYQVHLDVRYSSQAPGAVPLFDL